MNAQIETDRLVAVDFVFTIVEVTFSCSFGVDINAVVASAVATVGGSVVFAAKTSGTLSSDGSGEVAVEVSATPKLTAKAEVCAMWQCIGYEAIADMPIVGGGKLSASVTMRQFPMKVAFKDGGLLILR